MKTKVEEVDERAKRKIDYYLAGADGETEG